jgi:adenosylmethionine-8-amino-7-oxononanoate aminotransferase
MSLGGVPEFHKAFESILFQSHRIPSPYCYRCPMHLSPQGCSLACLAPLEALLEQTGERLAALIIEPLIQAAGGMIVYPPAYLQKVAVLTKRYGIHLILDEVATGFGRTGRMFALEHVGIEPDFLCLSKGLTAGFLPMAATLVTEEICQAFYAEYAENKTFYHGHTFTGNPLAAAAGLGSLQVFSEENPLGQLAGKVAHLKQRMSRFLELPWVGDLRQIGLIAALELVRDCRTKEAFRFAERVGWRIYLAGLEQGLILRPLGNIVYLWLPLSVTLAEIDEICDRMWLVLADPKNITAQAP